MSKRNFITVYVKDDELSRFTRLTGEARLRGISRSEMIRQAVELWERKHLKAKPPGRAKRKKVPTAKPKAVKPKQAKAKRRTRRPS